MSLTEKRKAKAEEKALEKEEAKAAFRLNQIKPATNAGFNALFVLLSFVCMFPLFYVFMISIQCGIYLFVERARNHRPRAADLRRRHRRRHGAGRSADDDDRLRSLPPEL